MQQSSCPNSSALHSTPPTGMAHRHPQQSNRKLPVVVPPALQRSILPVQQFARPEEGGPVQFKNIKQQSNYTGNFQYSQSSRPVCVDVSFNNAENGAGGMYREFPRASASSMMSSMVVAPEHHPSVMPPSRDCGLASSCMSTLSSVPVYNQAYFANILSPTERVRLRTWQMASKRYPNSGSYNSNSNDHRQHIYINPAKTQYNRHNPNICPSTPPVSVNLPPERVVRNCTRMGSTAAGTAGVVIDSQNETASPKLAPLCRTPVSVLAVISMEIDARSCSSVRYRVPVRAKVSRSLHQQQRIVR
eukprot:Lankesteria_metandrocarpae@DN1716_c0_g1_i1.p1